MRQAVTPLRLSTLLLAALSVWTTALAAQEVTAAGPSPKVITEEVASERASPRYLLQESHGGSVTTEDFHDRFQLITFGYLSCPDVCPTTMIEMQQILKTLGERAQYLQPIFISVDPQRDSLDVLGAYTANFDARILGMTGSETLVRWAARNFNVEYKKVQEPGAAANVYTMDHTAGMFLLGPDGQLLKKFGYSTPVQDITAEIEYWLTKDGK